MTYTLRNKKLERNLMHPRIGLWFTSQLQEAKDMLQSCYEYLDASHLSFLKPDFVVVNAETNEEIVLS